MLALRALKISKKLVLIRFGHKLLIFDLIPRSLGWTFLSPSVDMGSGQSRQRRVSINEEMEAWKFISFWGGWNGWSSGDGKQKTSCESGLEPASAESAQREAWFPFALQSYWKPLKNYYCCYFFSSKRYSYKHMCFRNITCQFLWRIPEFPWHTVPKEASFDISFICSF